MDWIRTWRRSGWDDTRKSGPWHIQGAYNLTWCGKRVQRILATERYQGDHQPDGKVCDDCVRRQATGRQKSWSR